MKTLLVLIGAVLVTAFTSPAQSLLTEPPETPEQRAAREVLAAPAQTADVLLNQLSDAFARLWDAPDPQAVLDEMHTRAPGSPARLFAINAAFGQMIAALLAAEQDTARLARFQALVAKIRPHTENPDGSITITPPEPEE